MLQSNHLRLLAATLLAGACATNAPTPDVTKQPQTQVTAESYVVKLTPDAKALRPGEKEELDQYLNHLGDLSEVEFSIRRTHRGMKLASLEPVERVLIAHGIDPKRIFPLAEIGVDYQGAFVDVEIIAKRYVAVSADCPNYSRVDMLGNANLNTSNFGCATASALALSVADPRDLARGRPTGPGSGAHSAAAIDRYDTDQVKVVPPFVDATTTTQSQ